MNLSGDIEQAAMCFHRLSTRSVLVEDGQRNLVDELDRVAEPAHCSHEVPVPLLVSRHRQGVAQISHSEHQLVSCGVEHHVYQIVGLEVEAHELVVLIGKEVTPAVAVIADCDERVIHRGWVFLIEQLVGQLVLALSHGLALAYADAYLTAVMDKETHSRLLPPEKVKCGLRQGNSTLHFITFLEDGRTSQGQAGADHLPEKKVDARKLLSLAKEIHRDQTFERLLEVQKTAKPLQLLLQLNFVLTKP